jgi:DNA helicase HerA-like ATPase
MTEFVIGPTERAAIVGRTNSGKTTLAKMLCGGYRSLVVIDPKWRFELPRTIVVVGSASEFAQVYPQRSTRVVYRPDPEDQDHADVDTVIRRVLHYGRTALLIDEAMEYATVGRIMPAYKRAITQGRELYVPVMSCTQRPIGVHNVILSEAEHLFAFDLQLDGDREKLVAANGAAGFLERPRSEHAFLYAGPATGGVAIHCSPLMIGSLPSPAAPAAAPMEAV